MTQATTLLVQAVHQTSEVAMRAAALSLQLRGEQSHGPAVVDALSDAIARTVFETVPDPSNIALVREIVECVEDRIVSTLRGMCRAVERMVQ